MPVPAHYHSCSISVAQWCMLRFMGALDLQVNRDGDVPVGTQLAWQIQALMTNGRLRPGEQLPSVRRLAEVAGVNVNTVRAVYERLEGEGFVVSRQGRGTYVAETVPQLDPGAVAARVYASSGAPPTREQLKEQISALEAQLSAYETAAAAPRTRRHPRLLSTEELAGVRDELAARLEQLDAMRDDLVDLLASIRTAMGEEPAPRRAAEKGAAAQARPATSES
jgi:DNA-binding transcriptional regulator YhcF (GntR family)